MTYDNLAATEKDRAINTLGLDILTQVNYNAANPGGLHSTFMYDGHGSTRMLTDFTGAVAVYNTVAQIFTYDAYGESLRFNKSDAAKSYLYSGEQFDNHIGQQYLRARYYDFVTGRFNRLDPLYGYMRDPQSFHKYLYTHADPVNGIDPSGLFKLIEMVQTAGYQATLVAINNPALVHAITITAMKVVVFGTIYQILAKAQFVPENSSINFVTFVAGIIATAGLSLSVAGPQMRSVTSPLKGTRNGNIMTGRGANIKHVARNAGNSPPYKSRSLAAEGKIAKNQNLVRVYDGEAPNPTAQGKWVMPKSEIKGLTPEQIKVKFALPGNAPTHFVKVNATGVPARVGYVGENFGSEGGGLQIELLERGASFTNATPIPVGGVQ